MKKLSQWWNDFLSWSFQRKANKLFMKHNVEYRDGDNT